MRPVNRIKLVLPGLVPEAHIPPGNRELGRGFGVCTPGDFAIADFGVGAAHK